MKTRADLYGQEAAGLLRIVSMYPGLSETQIYGFFPEKQEVVRSLLVHLKKQGRILQGPTGRYYPQGTSVSDTDPELIKAVWVLLDFIDRVEFHSVSDFPVKIIFFAGGELYEIISMPAGQEALVSHILSRTKEEDCGRRILIVEDPGQISILNIPCVSGYCTVVPDGRVAYYKKQ